MDGVREQVEAQLRTFDQQVVRPQQVRPSEVVRVRVCATHTPLGLEQKAAFLCSAKCCDDSSRGSSESQFRACLQKCSLQVQQVEQVVSVELQELQQRLGRCLGVCQDKSASLLRDGQDTQRAQALLDSCVADCAASTGAEVPKVFARLTKAHK
jgi:hypothetical protein